MSIRKAAKAKAAAAAAAPGLNSSVLSIVDSTET